MHEPFLQFLYNYPSTNHSETLPVLPMAYHSTDHHHDVHQHLPLLDLPISVGGYADHDHLPYGVDHHHWSNGLSMETNI